MAKNNWKTNHLTYKIENNVMFFVFFLFPTGGTGLTKTVFRLCAENTHTRATNYHSVLNYKHISYINIE